MEPTGIYRFERSIRLSIPLFLTMVPAGFPSPGDDYVEKSLDLNDLVTHPAATFIMRVQGSSMTGAGIRDGDLLLVDRALDATDNSIIVAALNGELIVRRLRIRGGRYYLVAEDPELDPIEITPDTDFDIHGVVAYSISKHV